MPTPSTLLPRLPALTTRLALVIAALALAPGALSATWSILAVDTSTGRVVIASATCVSQARIRDFPASGLMAIQAVVVPGVGVAAAQAATDRTRANQHLIETELRAGTDPRLILDLLRDDPAIAERQFGILDVQGRSIGFTGSENAPAALARQGRVAGTDIYYAVQGNILASDEVVLQAVAALEAADGDVLDRVMAAMEAADAAGGDRRCTCETEPTPRAPCDGKNAHVAYMLAADRTDPAERPFLYLDVTDENIGAEENANPVITLRLRFDRWRGAGGRAPATSPESAAASAAPSPPTHPSYAVGRELVIAGLGAGLAIGTTLVSADILSVPPQGLDPSDIAWSVDRNVLGDLSSGADRLSDRTRDLAVVYPFLLAWVAHPGARWSALGRRSLVYAEAFWLAGGLTYLGKETIGRARPFTYATSAARSTSSTFDVSQESAFESMPSGHATSAFVGAGLAITEHLLDRPQARGIERFGVAALGGAFGGATAALRVQAGKHFPSDVLAGAAVGLTAGVALPLVHRGERPWPTRRAWLEAGGGLLVGAVIGATAASVAY